jgi:hypothetical protein
MNGLSESTSLMMPTVKVSFPAGCCSWAVTLGAASSASNATSTTSTEARRSRPIPRVRPFPPALLVAPTSGPLAGFPPPTTAD